MHVLAGPGGNGGGLVAARHLHGAGVLVSRTAHPADLSGAAGRQLRSLRRVGVPVGVGVPRTDAPELVLDAVLGYSQQGPPRGTAADLIEWSIGQRVLALEAPSGLELETGTVRRPCVQAEATLTLALPKHGLRSPGTEQAVGGLFLADISVPPLVFQRMGVEYHPPFGRGPLLRITGTARPRPFALSTAR